MFLHPRSKDRPFHLGRFPMESLRRDDAVLTLEAGRAAVAAVPDLIRPRDDALSRAADHYRDILSQFAAGAPAAAKAPVPDDLERRSIDIKGSAYFMDTSCVGICRIPENAWIPEPTKLAHDFAVVVMVEHPRCAEVGNSAHQWTKAAVTAAADMRACEIVCCLAAYMRQMGFSAKAHVAGNGSLDVERLAVLAGLAVRRDDAVEHPYIGKSFALAAVSTDYELAVDTPLHADAAPCQGARLLVRDQRRPIRSRAQPPRAAPDPPERLPDGNGQAGGAPDHPDH